MYFENKCIKNGEVVEIIEIRLSIPITNSEPLDVISRDKELIHLHIYKNVLMDYHKGNPDFIYERIFQILMKSKDVSIENKCDFVNWHYKCIEFIDIKHRTCNTLEKQEFILNQEDKIIERINGNNGHYLNEYLNLINNSLIDINLIKKVLKEN